MRLVVRPEDMVDGDTIVELQTGTGTNDSWAGLYVLNGALYHPDGTVWGAGRIPTWSTPSYKFVVERQATLVCTQPMYQGTVTITPSRTVADWPLSCPKCKRPSSAYLGLNAYDCRHGCYAKPDKAGAK